MLTCPHCGEGRCRSSRVSSLSDRLRALVGLYPFRCASCKARHTRSVWALRDLYFAHCPHCWRTNLTRFWVEKYRPVPPITRVLTGFGAKQLHCPSCRVDFATFRPLLRERRRRSHAPSAEPASLAETC